MIRRFIQHEHVRTIEKKLRQAHARPLSAAEQTQRLLDLFAAEEHQRQRVADLLHGHVLPAGADFVIHGRLGIEVIEALIVVTDVEVRPPADIAVVRIVLSLGLIIASKLAALAVPLVLKQIVDRLNVAPALLLLPVAMLLAYGAARVGITLFTETRQVVFARVMARASRQIAVKVFRHLHDLSLRFHLDRRTGGVARDLERGSTAIADLLDWTLYTILPTAVEVLLVTGLLLWEYDWTFALIILATLAAYAAWSFIVTDWRTRHYRAAVEADTRANERAVDSLLNYETVKYFNNED